ncbi:N-acetyltransferase [Flavimobilis marinus]|uniref:Ribosomal protein S18 acetylase RimI n=1 Tax=Flavimobilis marinus TaxID=285351 RepID=A0A1I2G2Q4_9MICO|nr:GNAT family N-acetyltransferase [Flavimobilis marinus]GHG50269.1 N-acetyltransferase [Flavimobilis marinus]SFF11832.1 Ribosomal protein S18 acetylase RimI [Flavimobilis marinus]
MVDLEDVTIRTATVADAADIAQVHVASWREAYAGIVPADYLAALDAEERRALWERALARGEITTWLAVVDSRTVGFATLGPRRDEDAEPGDLEIYAMYLDPEAWGRGVARDLMRHSLAEVPDGASLSLWVLGDNDRAQRFYRRHGFAPDGVERMEEYGDTYLVEVRYLRAK